jgi:hypothetical protein
MGFFARRLRKNKARDSRPESPSNPGIDRGDSRLTDCQRTAMMDRALTLALTVAVVANTLCLWSYL